MATLLAVVNMLAVLLPLLTTLLAALRKTPDGTPHLDPVLAFRVTDAGIVRAHFAAVDDMRRAADDVLDAELVRGPPASAGHE